MKHYTEAFKTEVLEARDSENLSVNETCERFGVTPATVRDWEKKRGKTYTAKPIQTNTEATSDPIKENARLRQILGNILVERHLSQ